MASFGRLVLELGTAQVRIRISAGDFRCRLFPAEYCLRRMTMPGVAGRCRTSGLAPRSAKPRRLRACRVPCRPTTFEPLVLAQHCIGLRSLSQIIDRYPTSIPLVEKSLVLHGSVHSEQKLVG